MRYDDSAEDDAGDGWIESTEGDLDPELTEEAGYLAWDPPERRNNWLPILWKLAALSLIVALIGTVVLPAFL